MLTYMREYFESCDYPNYSDREEGLTAQLR